MAPPHLACNVLYILHANDFGRSTNLLYCKFSTRGNARSKCNGIVTAACNTNCMSLSSRREKEVWSGLLMRLPMFLKEEDKRLVMMHKMDYEIQIFASQTTLRWQTIKGRVEESLSMSLDRAVASGRQRHDTSNAYACYEKVLRVFLF